MASKKKIARFLLCTVLFTVCISFSFGQSAEFFTDIIESKGITWEQAAFLVMGGSGKTSDEASPSQAWKTLEETGWFKQLPDSQKTITTAQYSLLISKAFNVKGGLWYTLFKNARYSYRELVYKNIVPGSFDPYASVKGTDALKILDKAMSLSSTTTAKSRRR